MKSMLKKVLLATLLLVVTVTLTGCKDKGIVGKWEYKTGGYTYTFNEDGTGTYDVGSTKMEFTYKTDGDKLSITYKGNTTAFETTFTIDKNTLNIKDSFGNDTIYNRK